MAVTSQTLVVTTFWLLHLFIKAFSVFIHATMALKYRDLQHSIGYNLTWKEQFYKRLIFLFFNKKPPIHSIKTRLSPRASQSGCTKMTNRFRLFLFKEKYIMAPSKRSLFHWQARCRKEKAPPVAACFLQECLLAACRLTPTTTEHHTQH